MYAIYDVHELTEFIPEEALDGHLMIEYYGQIANLFWTSKNHLFHAYALYKHFALVKTVKRDLSIEKIRLLASQVALAALSVPYSDYEMNTTSYNALNRQIRLMELLNLSQIPTRKNLVSNVRVFFYFLLLFSIE